MLKGALLLIVPCIGNSKHLYDTPSTREDSSQKLFSVTLSAFPSCICLLSFPSTWARMFRLFTALSLMFAKHPQLGVTSGVAGAGWGVGGGRGRFLDEWMSKWSKQRKE